MNKKRQFKVLDRKALEMASECLRILAHPSRLQIVQLLLSGKQYSVNEIADYCSLNQPTTSDHLRLMQRCGFLESQKEGRTVYYAISEPHLEDIMSCIQSRFG